MLRTDPGGDTSQRALSQSEAREGARPGGKEPASEGELQAARLGACLLRPGRRPTTRSWLQVLVRSWLLSPRHLIVELDLGQIGTLTGPTQSSRLFPLPVDALSLEEDVRSQLDRANRQLRSSSQP